MSGVIENQGVTKRLVILGSSQNTETTLIVWTWEI